MSAANPNRFTNKQLERAFGVSSMTLYLWRQGTATKAAMPTVKNTGRFVLYDRGPITAWAKKNGVEFVVPLDQVAANAELKPAKAGPKTKPKDANTKRVGEKLKKRIAARTKH